VITCGMRVPVAVWQPCELLNTCYLLAYRPPDKRTDHATPSVAIARICAIHAMQDSNNNSENVYDAVIMSQPLQRVHSVYLINAGSATGGRGCTDQANLVGL